MVFNSEPYDDDAFEEAIGETYDAIERYDPKLYGWEWAPEAGPQFQLAQVGASGYITLAAVIVAAVFACAHFIPSNDRRN